MYLKKLFSIRSLLIMGAIVLIFLPGAHAEKVDWQGPGGLKIKEIRHPSPPADTETELARTYIVTAAAPAPTIVNAIQIDSPPEAGFVPWIAVSVTDEISTIESDLMAYPEYQLAGDYFPNRNADWGIGIYDTGASAHVMGYGVSQSLGLKSDNLTEATVEIYGATGSVHAAISMPIGLFISGTGNLNTEPNLIDPSAMVGLSNVAIAVGQGGEPDLPTAIGSPLSVYFAAAMNNEQPISVDYHGTTYSGPDITLYPADSNMIPTYANYFPLELKPFGSYNVQFIFDYNQALLNLILDPFSEYAVEPGTPSILTGLSPTQSTFYVHSVDLTEGTYQAQDRERFLFDTGAQVTVIGTRMAARLGIDPDNEDFMVVIEGVNGFEIDVPGFYIDKLTIPAIGQWLEFTNVPVILLDIDSAAGGKLDGIIGMNLFTEFNIIVHGGGLFGTPEPKVQFEPISTIIADIAPETRDGKVNMIDLSAMSAVWMTSDSNADIAPLGNPDGTVDLEDLLVMADYWLEDITQNP